VRLSVSLSALEIAPPREGLAARRWFLPVEYHRSLPAGDALIDTSGLKDDPRRWVLP
jgi:hypothetical protein